MGLWAAALNTSSPLRAHLHLTCSLSTFPDVLVASARIGGTTMVRQFEECFSPRRNPFSTWNVCTCLVLVR
eukprot:1842722-Pleurochrysis_carterae.AAC.1